MRHLMNNTAIVYQLTNTTNSMGGRKENWSVRIASLPCRLSTTNVATNANETSRFGKTTVENAWKLFCEYNTTNSAIKESDKITISAIEYEITGIYNTADHHFEINLSEIR